MKAAGIAFEAKRADVVLVDVTSGESQWIPLGADHETDAFEAARQIGRRIGGPRVQWIDVGLAFVESPAEPSLAQMRMQGAIVAGIPQVIPLDSISEHSWREALSPDDPDSTRAVMFAAAEHGFRAFTTAGNEPVATAYRAFAVAWLGLQRYANYGRQEGARA